jgi:hypothetical protein
VSIIWPDIWPASSPKSFDHGEIRLSSSKILNWSAKIDDL